jgi:AAA family ATP:ADP antiporter
MLGAAAVTAQLVGGKATRDALFLTSLDFTALPMMLIATSIFSILLVAAHARATRKISPAVAVPISFVASGVLFLAEWLIRPAAPSATAILVYLHISAAGPLLASGFWLIATERFDPRTGKKRFGQIAGAGTIGGLLGALLSERVAALSGAPDMLLFLAAFHVVTAGLVRLVATPATSADATTVLIDPTAGAPVLSRSGLRVIADAPHLQHLAALVLFGTTSAALIEYLFKARAVQTFGPGDNLLRFFAVYYAATSVITFILQTSTSRSVMNRFGLALTSSSPSIGLLAGSLGGLLFPGFGSLLVARGAESVFRGSWFRAGYELFYTPIPASEKRAAKSIIDVAFDRLGDGIGGGLVRLALLLAPAAQSSTILSLAMLSSIGAIIAASRLNHWYVRTLESSLVRRGANFDLSETEGDVTRQVLIDVRERNSRMLRLADDSDLIDRPFDPELSDILALRSGNPERAIDVLSREDGITAGLIPFTIPLLAVDPLADYALFALRKVAEEHVGELADALVDPNRDYAVRRRLARVFSVCVSQRSADAVMVALEDARFDVRFQAARSLAAIRDKNPRVHVDSEAIYAAVLREVAVGRPVWESRRLLDAFVSVSPLDEFVRDRAGQSLAHVFTLLSLVLPREPLQIAFRSLNSDDRQLRGTALEYLEQTLPAAVRQALWPYLVYRRMVGPARERGDIIADLLRASESVTLQNIAKRQDRDRIAEFGPI